MWWKFIIIFSSIGVAQSFIPTNPWERPVTLQHNAIQFDLFEIAKGFGINKSEIQTKFPSLNKDIDEFLEKGTFGDIQVCYPIESLDTVGDVLKKVIAAESNYKERMESLLKNLKKMYNEHVSSYFHSSYKKPFSHFCQVFIKMTSRMYEDFFLPTLLDQWKVEKQDFMNFFKDEDSALNMKNYVVAMWRNDKVGMSAPDFAIVTKIFNTLRMVNVTENKWNYTLSKLISDERKISTNLLYHLMKTFASIYDAFRRVMFNMKISDVAKATNVDTFKSAFDIFVHVRGKGNLLDTEQQHPLSYLLPNLLETQGLVAIKSTPLMSLAMTAWNTTEEFIKQWLGLSEMSHKLMKYSVEKIISSNNIEGFQEQYYYCISGYTFVDETSFRMLTTGFRYKRKQYLWNNVLRGCLYIARRSKLNTLERIFSFNIETMNNNIIDFLEKNLLLTRQHIDANFGVTATKLFEVLNLKAWKNTKSTSLGAIVIMWNDTTTNKEFHERLAPRITSEKDSNDLIIVVAGKLGVSLNDIMTTAGKLNYPVSLGLFATNAKLSAIMHCYQVTVEDTLLSVLLKVKYLDENPDSHVMRTLTMMKSNGMNISIANSTVHQLCSQFEGRLLSDYYDIHLAMNAQQMDITKEQLKNSLASFGITNVYEKLYIARTLNDKMSLDKQRKIMRMTILETFHKISIKNLTGHSEQTIRNMTVIQLINQVLGVSPNGVNTHFFKGILSEVVVFYLNHTVDTVFTDFFTDYSNFSMHYVSQWIMEMTRFSMFAYDQLNRPILLAMYNVSKPVSDLPLKDIIQTITKGHGNKHVMKMFDDVTQSFFMKNLSDIANTTWSFKKLLVMSASFVSRLNTKTHAEIQSMYIHNVRYIKNQTFDTLNKIMKITAEENVEETHKKFFDMNMEMLHSMFTYNRSECQYKHYRNNGYRNVSMVNDTEKSLNELDEMIVQMSTPDEISKEKLGMTLNTNVGNFINTTNEMGITKDQIMCYFPEISKHIMFLEMYHFDMVRTCYGLKDAMNLTAIMQQIMNREKHSAQYIDMMLHDARMIDNNTVSMKIPSTQNMSISYFCPTFYNLTRDMYQKILLAELNKYKAIENDIVNFAAKINGKDDYVKMLLLASVRNDEYMKKKAKTMLNDAIMMFLQSVKVSETEYNNTLYQVISTSFNVSSNFTNLVMSEFFMISTSIEMISRKVMIKYLKMSLPMMPKNVRDILEHVDKYLLPIQKKMNYPLINVACMLHKCGIKHIQSFTILEVALNFSSVKESVLASLLHLDQQSVEMMKNHTIESRISSMSKNISSKMYQYYPLSSLIVKMTFDKMSPITQVANRFLKRVEFSGYSHFIQTVTLENLLKHFDVPYHHMNMTCYNIVYRYGGMDMEMLRIFLTFSFTNMMKEKSCQNISSYDNITPNMTLIKACDVFKEKASNCDFACPHDLSQVCGSNGVTYHNRCYLKRENCQKNTNVTVLFDGDCNKTTAQALKFTFQSVVKNFDQFYKSTIFDLLKSYTSVSKKDFIDTFKIDKKLVEYLEKTNFTMLQACYLVFIEMTFHDATVRIVFLNTYNTDTVARKLYVLRQIDNQCVNAYFPEKYTRKMQEFCPVFHRMVYNMFDPFLIEIGLKALQIPRSDYYKMEQLLGAREIFHEYTAAIYRGDYYTTIVYAGKIKNAIENHAKSIKISAKNLDQTFFHVMTNQSEFDERLFAYSMTNNAGFPQNIHKVGNLTLRDLINSAGSDASKFKNVKELLDSVLEVGKKLQVEVYEPICYTGLKAGIGMGNLYGKTLIELAKKRWQVTENFFINWWSINGSPLERITRRNISSLMMYVKGLSEKQKCFISGFAFGDDNNFADLSTGYMCAREKAARANVSGGVQYFLKHVAMGMAMQLFTGGSMNTSITTYLRDASGIMESDLMKVFKPDIISIFQSISFEHVTVNPQMTLYGMVENWNKSFPSQEEKFHSSLRSFSSGRNVMGLTLQQVMMAIEAHNYHDIMETFGLQKDVIAYILNETLANLHWCYGLQYNDSIFSFLMKVKLLNPNRLHWRTMKITNLLQHNVELQNQVKNMKLNSFCAFIPSFKQGFFNNQAVLMSIAAEFQMTVDELKQVVEAIGIEQDYKDVTLAHLLNDMWGGEIARNKITSKLQAFLETISPSNINGTIEDKRKYTPYKIIEMQTNVSAALYEKDFKHEANFSFGALFLDSLKHPLDKIYADLAMSDKKISMEMFMSSNLFELNKTIHENEQMIDHVRKIPLVYALYLKGHSWNEMYKTQSLYNLTKMATGITDGLLESYFAAKKINVSMMKEETLEKVSMKLNISMTKVKFLPLYIKNHGSKSATIYVESVKNFKKIVSIEEATKMFTFSGSPNMLELHMSIFEMKPEEVYEMFSCNYSVIAMKFYGAEDFMKIMSEVVKTYTVSAKLDTIDEKAFEKSKPVELNQLQLSTRVIDVLNSKSIPIASIVSSKAMDVLTALYSVNEKQIQFYFALNDKIVEFLKNQAFSSIVTCYQLRLDMNLQEIFYNIKTIEKAHTKTRIRALLKPFIEINVGLNTIFPTNFDKPLYEFWQQYLAVSNNMYNQYIKPWVANKLGATINDLNKLIDKVEIETEMKSYWLSALRGNILMSTYVTPFKIQEKFGIFGNKINVATNNHVQTLFALISENMGDVSEELIKQVIIGIAKFPSYYATLSNLTLNEIFKNVPDRYNYNRVTFIYEKIDELVKQKSLLSKKPFILSGPEGNYYGIDRISHLKLITLITHTLHLTEKFFFAAFEIEENFAVYIRQLTSLQAIGLLNIKERKERFQYLSPDDVYNKNKRALLDSKTANHFVRSQYTIKLTYLGMWQVVKELAVNRFSKIYNVTDITKSNKKCSYVLNNHLGFEDIDLPVFFNDDFLTACTKYSFPQMFGKYKKLINEGMTLMQVSEMLRGKLIDCGFCTEHYKPVCGSDRKTYSNLCKLNVSACETGTDISVAYNGTCSSNEFFMNLQLLALPYYCNISMEQLYSQKLKDLSQACSKSSISSISTDGTRYVEEQDLSLRDIQMMFASKNMDWKPIMYLNLLQISTIAFDVNSFIFTKTLSSFVKDSFDDTSVVNMNIIDVLKMDSQWSNETMLKNRLNSWSGNKNYDFKLSTLGISSDKILKSSVVDLLRHLNDQTQGDYGVFITFKYASSNSLCPIYVNSTIPYIQGACGLDSRFLSNIKMLKLSVSVAHIGLMVNRSDFEMFDFVTLNMMLSMGVKRLNEIGSHPLIVSARDAGVPFSDVINQTLSSLSRKIFRIEEEDLLATIFGVSKELLLQSEQYTLSQLVSLVPNAGNVKRLYTVSLNSIILVATRKKDADTVEKEELPKNIQQILSFSYLRLTFIYQDVTLNQLRIGNPVEIISNLFGINETNLSMFSGVKVSIDELKSTTFIKLFKLQTVFLGTDGKFETNNSLDAIKVFTFFDFNMQTFLLSTVSQQTKGRPFNGMVKELMPISNIQTSFNSPMGKFFMDLLKMKNPYLPITASLSNEFGEVNVSEIAMAKNMEANEYFKDTTLCDLIGLHVPQWLNLKFWMKVKVSDWKELHRKKSFEELFTMFHFKHAIYNKEFFNVPSKHINYLKTLTPETFEKDFRQMNDVLMKTSKEFINNMNSVVMKIDDQFENEEIINIIATSKYSPEVIGNLRIKEFINITLNISPELLFSKLKVLPMADPALISAVNEGTLNTIKTIQYDGAPNLILDHDKCSYLLTLKTIFYFFNRSMTRNEMLSQHINSAKKIISQKSLTDVSQMYKMGISEVNRLKIFDITEKWFCIKKSMILSETSINERQYIYLERFTIRDISVFSSKQNPVLRNKMKDIISFYGKSINIKLFASNLTEVEENVGANVFQSNTFMASLRQYLTKSETEIKKILNSYFSMFEASFNNFRAEEFLSLLTEVRYQDYDEVLLFQQTNVDARTVKDFLVTLIRNGIDRCNVQASSCASQSRCIPQSYGFACISGCPSGFFFNTRTIDCEDECSAENKNQPRKCKFVKKVYTKVKGLKMGIPYVKEYSDKTSRLFKLIAAKIKRILLEALQKTCSECKNIIIDALTQGSVVADFTVVTQATNSTPTTDVKSAVNTTLQSGDLQSLNASTTSAITADDANICDTSANNCAGTSKCVSKSDGFECECADGYEYSNNDCVKKDEDDDDHLGVKIAVPIVVVAILIFIVIVIYMKKRANPKDVSSFKLDGMHNPTFLDAAGNDYAELKTVQTVDDHHHNGEFNKGFHSDDRYGTLKFNDAESTPSEHGDSSLQSFKIR